MTTSYWF